MPIINNAATIPYQLRHHKAIERNIFIDLLKILNSYPDISLSECKYVGFGAAFLEDFKLMHLEFGITKMDSIECDLHAFSRQTFNNPYNFIRSIQCDSKNYLSEYYDSENRMIIWFDYASSNELRDQLMELEELGSKLLPFDIIKFTLNAQIGNYINKFKIKETGVKTHQELIKCFNKDATFQNYIPPQLEVAHMKNFDAVIRNMAIRAINRGLSSAGVKYKFNSISAFTYADGQTMTTLTGIVTENTEDFERIVENTGLQNWPFLIRANDDFILADKIAVPSMTITERFEIDKIIHHSPEEIYLKTPFKYGRDEKEHETLIGGYCKFYKYLPFYGKVIY